jgi:endonuclease YncB( thermonuclease family)
VIDGDTIEVELDGIAYKVRYIGMNTPEMDEFCGPEAKAVNASLVERQTVRLVKDVSKRIGMVGYCAMSILATSSSMPNW